MSPRRIALVVLATAGLLGFAITLLNGEVDSGPTGLDLVGPVGAFLMGGFATGCAAAAAKAAGRGQRLAWTAIAVDFGGWSVSAAIWWYVAAGGSIPISEESVSELGYVVLPVFALGAALLVPGRDDSNFGLQLALDGVLVAASLSVALGSVALGSGSAVDFPSVLLSVITALYLGLVVMAVIVTHKAEPDRRLSPLLLAAGFAAIAVAGANRIFMTGRPQTPRTLVELGWVVGIYLLALSALASRPGPDLETGDTRAWARMSILLPYLPLLVAVFIGGAHFWPDDRSEALVYAAGMVVVATVLTRHMLALNRKQRLLEAMTDAALRDAVTGLANRRLLDERLAHAAQLHQRLAVPLSILSIRVDDFKVVNDTLGYAASDALLRGVGARIQGSVRAGDTVARMGGDEFAILVEDRPEVAAQVATRIARAFDSALEIGDNRVYIHLSIGVATAQPDDDASFTAADLLNQAEAARSRAEQTSATDVQTFMPERDAHLGRRQTFRDGVARLQLLWDLRRAIDDRLLTLVYQPQFGMLNGAVCGAEALLRWEHPTLGTLEPREFLPLVREHGLMDAVTDLVLSRAVADGAAWHAAGTEIPVAVNLWARSLDEDTLPDRILTVLDEHGMSASLLTVEITEELMVADFVKGRAVLNRLREAGIRVSIDDFGSGYSTLTYLRELPIDEVKLDRQLIAPILYDQRAATIARSVIELAEEFDIASVAEGIENEETARWLRRFGCDVVQGNYYCGPLPAGEIPQVPSVLARRAR
ncbi:bifunctional diguanylate cyclase/phosphodiesterase [Candidatus Mycobacterium wuenschmannii]|uniref:Bifunctional diguanylate cyclase/phosphodiesterase n=1 Tax=Candidatus Mycobacterium wuenschmannii TaxID=3027808 RepID=A0ABY8VZX0_9MYCO|nr:bifunctional diguanylate cyclase/phosphodiesterase [Candidatus Mycobacterium wuenschmannii]WIM88846.1 bifunctional diguanylate cyclase/phosphodiesterase [Candidatus Mycobacterium wuenschmannii]